MFSMGQQQPVQNRSSKDSVSGMRHGEARKWIGRQVKINRGGPDSFEGTLLAINGDVIVVASSNNNNNNNSNKNNNKSGNDNGSNSQDNTTVIYVSTKHVKSISEGGSNNGNNYSGRSGYVQSMSYLQTSNFSSVLEGMRQQFVQINNGPDKVEGFLADSDKEFLLLVTQDREYVRVPVYHIKSICLSSNNKNNNNNNNNNNKNGSDKNKNSKNKSGKNKSGGSRNKS